MPNIAEKYANNCQPKKYHKEVRGKVKKGKKDEKMLESRSEDALVERERYLFQVQTLYIFSIMV